MHPPKEIGLIPEGVIGLLKIEEARLQLSPMGNARLNIETR
jgi:hypothetical protein